jgi:hypothetical protein
MKWLEKLGRSRLMKRMKQNARKVILVSPEKVRKVGIVWHEENRDAFQYLQDYFGKDGTVVRNICYSEEKVPSHSQVITRKQTNWLGFPVGSVPDEFIRTEFDLLINVTIKPCFALEVITGLSAASFKAGWDFSKSGFYDLSVDVTSRPESLYLAEQLIFYLQTLNK